MVQVSDKAILLVIAAYAAAFVVFGFLVDRPAAIAEGLVAILTSRDTLLTDYFGVGGIGAGCVNAGLLTLCACFVYYKAGAKMSGAAVACLFLVLGFALFGKNLLNAWGIVIGVWLYSRFKGETFATNINTAFFGLAPRAAARRGSPSRCRGSSGAWWRRRTAGWRSRRDGDQDPGEPNQVSCTHRTPLRRRSARRLASSAPGRYWPIGPPEATAVHFILETLRDRR